MHARAVAAAERPASRSRVLEVDADVVRVAREQLGLDDVPGLRVSTADARAGVSSLRPAAFDAAVADVFVGPACPTTCARWRPSRTCGAS